MLCMTRQSTSLLYFVCGYTAWCQSWAKSPKVKCGFVRPGQISWATQPSYRSNKINWTTSIAYGPK